MDGGDSKERRFLVGVVKVVAAIAGVIVIATLLDDVLPATLVRFLASAVGLLGIFWAARGTSLDPFGQRRK